MHQVCIKSSLGKSFSLVCLHVVLVACIYYNKGLIYSISQIHLNEYNSLNTHREIKVMSGWIGWEFRRLDDKIVNWKSPPPVGFWGPIICLISVILL